VRETQNYPSFDSGGIDVSKRDRSVNTQISAKYTIAPAYNKGAYQVIPNDNVRDIGK